MDRGVGERRWVLTDARLLAGIAFMGAWGLYSMNWWYTGPLYPIVHVVVVGGCVLLSRTLRRTPDGPSGALSALALVLPLMGDHPHTGDPREMVEEVLRRTWLFWLPLTALLAYSLYRRRRSLSLLDRWHAVATCTAVTSAPLVAIAGRDAISGGLDVPVVYPVVVASFATACSWVFGRPSPAGRALRRFAPPVTVACVLAATIASLAVGSTAGALTYGLRLASFGQLGWALVLLAVALHYARDPIVSSGTTAQ